MSATTQRTGLATPEEAAEWLKVTTRHLRSLRSRNEGPHPVRVGNRIRYAWVDVYEYARANRRGA